MQVTATILAFSATLVGVMAGNLHVHNSCGFPVYCSSASNGEATSPSKIITGKSYKGAYAAQAGKGGVTLKCSKDAKIPDNNQYQLEMDVDAAGHTWADLSTMNGHPFNEFQRKLAMDDPDCEDLECAPGANNCESCPLGMPSCNDTNINYCNSQKDVWLYLC